MIKIKMMERRSKGKDIIFLAGGVLMVIGAGCFAFGFIHPSLLKTVCWIYLLGSLMFSIPQIMQSYEQMGGNLIDSCIDRTLYYSSYQP
jgi:hypothetical protein